MQENVVITYGLHKLDVRLYVTPEENQTFDHPGCPMELEVEAIHIGEHPDDISDIFTDEQIEEICDLCFKALEARMENSYGH